MKFFRLLVKGSEADARRAAAQHGCTVQRCIELPERSNTVVLAMCDGLEVHRWYGGDARERALVRDNKPLPPGALLYFGEGAGDAHRASSPGN